jgi:hypothetical protein
MKIKNFNCAYGLRMREWILSIQINKTQKRLDIKQR